MILVFKEFSLLFFPSKFDDLILYFIIIIILKPHLYDIYNLPFGIFIKFYLINFNFQIMSLTSNYIIDFSIFG